MLQNVITGVALVKAAGDEISFYFGCVAQTRGIGGAGLFIGSLDDASARRVYALRDNDTSEGVIRAGALFTADSGLCVLDPSWQRSTSLGVCLISTRWFAVILASVLSLVSSVRPFC